MKYSGNLLVDLNNLRAEIKNTEKWSTGKTPVVCTDDALYEIYRLRPKKLSDFQSVPGIGNSFITNYGEQFLKVLKHYEEEPSEVLNKMNASTQVVLKRLEEKLINVNRSNKLLYLPKAQAKWAVDLYSADSKLDLSKLLFGSANFSVLSSISAAEAADFSSEEYLKQKKFASLLREANKQLRDKGQNNLYLGYPFVSGRLPGENFDVRAPLVLFPIEADVSPTEIKIRKDEDRDILYNTTLILAYYKFNNIVKDIPDPEVSDLSKSTFLADILEFFNNCGLKIQPNNTDSIIKFKDYKSGEFPKFKPGELYVENCAVLGNFPVCANSIQKDFDAILKSNKINPLLEELLVEQAELDEYGDFYSGEEEYEEKDKKIELSEHDLVYINDLNSSQETVLSAINTNSSLVVQGPPGTGKSQCIASLISEFVSQKKTVLMVSEKKTALDVVYSRLGNLSKYALMLDDLGDKESFYKQLSNMLYVETHSYDTQEEIAFASDQIDEKIEILTHIADKLYEVGSFGIEPYKLFNENKKISQTDEKYKAIRTALAGRSLDLNYAQLCELKRKFSNERLLNNINSFVAMNATKPYLKDMRVNMSDDEVFGLSQDLLSIKESKDEWLKKNFFQRLFTKGHVKGQISAYISKYFDSKQKGIVKSIFDDVDAYIEGVGDYSEYQSLLSLYSKLSNFEINYFEMLASISEECRISLMDANLELYNHFLFIEIDRFITKNHDVLNDIDDFESIIDELSEAIAQKKELTRTLMESILFDSMNELIHSKRHNEILRAIEGKRKPSVSKFIKKFDFEIFKAVKVWLMTPEVVSEIIPLQPGIFDLVVFDEASQMYPEKGMPAILRAKKVVIAGDHKQLRPNAVGIGRADVNFEEVPEDFEMSAALEEESLLDLARFKYDDVMLNFHYRSKYEELIAFSNYAFYKGRLYVSPNIKKPEKPPIEFHKLEDGRWIDRCNRVEAEYVVSLLKQIFDERKNNETIGIITFNITQRDMIDDLIDRQCALDPEFAAHIRQEINRKDNGEDTGLFVKNIESVQGDERDIIIFSIGYARNQDGRIIRNFGSLNMKGGENRLNVAISRAKTKVHIVASISPDELQVEDTKNDGPKILKKYLEYSYAISSGDRATAQSILHSFSDDPNSGETITFDSPLEEEVFDALREKGYDIDTQVGIGRYRIDLAIKKNGNYILGIECDGRLYHSSKSARERDYHRQKYLESRGWRIHRIWSTNWWSNPKAEIDKLCTVIDSM